MPILLRAILTVHFLHPAVIRSRGCDEMGSMGMYVHVDLLNGFVCRSTLSISRADICPPSSSIPHIDKLHLSYA